MLDNQLSMGEIESVVTHVHQGAIDVLGPVTDPQTVHQSKFSMGTVLGLIAAHNSADLVSFDGALQDELVSAFRDRVTMELDPEVDDAYPMQWIGKVTVTTKDGKTYTAVVQEPKGDPGNTLSRSEIEDKLKRLGTYQGAASPAELEHLAARIWQLEQAPTLGAVMNF
jgi:2-methylcitrate dehydratase PrpD